MLALFSHAGDCSMHEHEFSLVIASRSIATLKETTLAWAVLCSRLRNAGYLWAALAMSLGEV